MVKTPYIKLLPSLAILLFLATKPAFSQKDTYWFFSQKVTLLNYGVREHTDTPYPVKITLNIREQYINVSTNFSPVLKFLEQHDHFKIKAVQKSRQNSTLYITEEGFVFSIHHRRREIIVGKKDMSVHTHSLRFHEIMPQ